MAGALPKTRYVVVEFTGGEAAELDLDGRARPRRRSRGGLLFKDRVSAVTTFIDDAERIAAGGTVVDPDVLRQLIRRRQDPLERLSPGTRGTRPYAEGRSNAILAANLHLSEAAVNKYILGVRR